MSKFTFNRTNNSAIIVDYRYYTAHSDEIDEWLWLHNSDRQGMVILFSDEQTRLMFMLKWN